MTDIAGSGYKTEQTKGERRWRDERNQDMNIIHATLWMMEYI